VTGEWVTQAPEEDAGASTQDRYAYQHHCIARHLLLSILEDAPITVVCEWKEDFIVHDGAGWEAVSVKHREGTQGPFTIASLVSDGGLGKLFRTWRQSDRHARCRLMTNASLAPGKTGARAVATFADGTDGHRGAVVSDLCQRLNAPSADVARFLQHALVVDAELPARRFIETQQRVDLLGPVYGALGETADGSTNEYWALLGPIARRNADPSMLAEDHRLALATDASEQEARLGAATVAARAITTEQAITYLTAARVAPYATLPPVAPGAPPQTRMTRKLKAGQLSATDRRLAIRLRNAWYAVTTEHADNDNIDREIAALEVAVQRQAGDAQRAAEQHGTPYAGAMLADLRLRLAAAPGTWAARRALLAPDLLEGLAYELTDRCDVWWSPEEDVDLEAPDAT
jgi:hypothetical protein